MKVVFKRLGGVFSPGLTRNPGDEKIHIRKDTHTMSKDNVIELKKPERFVDDPITEVLRSGARKLLLVIISATEGGKKRLIALDSGFRESELSS